MEIALDGSTSENGSFDIGRQSPGFSEIPRNDVVKAS